MHSPTPYDVRSYMLPSLLPSKTPGYIRFIGSRSKDLLIFFFQLIPRDSPRSQLRDAVVPCKGSTFVVFREVS